MSKILTLKEFQNTRKKVNRKFMIENYGKEFTDDQYSNFYHVYGLKGYDGYIEILDERGWDGITELKYFLNIGNWDDCSNSLNYFEERLYCDHYLPENGDLSKVKSTYK